MSTVQDKERQETQQKLTPSLTWRTWICYGVGHVLNDLCAAMWFTYFILYFHSIAGLSHVTAGTLLLVGQCADGLFTPVVGIESDKAGFASYGRRKSWHLAGVISVLISFPFIFNLCIYNCHRASILALMIYYIPFIILFQCGWAATQISHLALIPELSGCEREKVGLNAIRYAFTVCSNIFVYVMVWILIDIHQRDEHGGVGDQLCQKDAKPFQILVFIVLGVGSLFMIIFHIGVKEKPRPKFVEDLEISGKHKPSNWKLWLKVPQFYQVGMLYMCTRLINNVTMVYIPMYTTISLQLPKSAIAVVPLVLYISCFLSTYTTNLSNKYIGRKISFLFGLILVLGSSACIKWGLKLGYQSNKKYLIYGVAVAQGMGGSTLLVTSLAMTSDLIGAHVETGAFVYGAMSFLDKLSNGIAIQIIQALHPCEAKPMGTTNNTIRASIISPTQAPTLHHPTSPYCPRTFYDEIMAYVPGGAAVVAFFVLLTLVNTDIGKKKNNDKGSNKSTQEAKSPLLRDCAKYSCSEDNVCPRNGLEDDNRCSSPSSVGSINACYSTGQSVIDPAIT